MNIAGRFAATFFMSLAIHLIILYFMSFNLFPDYFKINREVKVILISRPVSKSQPLKKEKKADNRIKKDDRKLPRVKGDPQKSAGIIRPIINLPSMDLDKKIEFETPKYNGTQIAEIKDLKTLNLDALSREIEETEESLSTRSSSKGESKGEVVDDFFELKNISNKSRKLVFVPEKKGSFRLETDTNLVLRFNIGKNGIPYNISFVNRSFSEIEHIAIDFVKQLRFEAVDYDKPDEAEIVLHFKVK
jgi:hypothetical protein